MNLVSHIGAFFLGVHAALLFILAFQWRRDIQRERREEAQRRFLETIAREGDE